MQAPGRDVVDEPPIIAWARGVVISAPRNTPVSDWLPIAEHAGVERLRVAARAADGDAAAAVREALHAAGQDPPADRVDDEIDAAAAGDRADLVDPVVVRVVDAVIEPEVLQPLEPLVARRGRDHGRAGALRELDGGDADTARAGLDQHRLAGRR